MGKIQFQDPSKAMDNSNTETNMHATSVKAIYDQEQARAIALYFTVIILPVKSIHSHYKQYKNTDICI